MVELERFRSDERGDVLDGVACSRMGTHAQHRHGGEHEDGDHEHVGQAVVGGVEEPAGDRTDDRRDLPGGGVAGDHPRHPFGRDDIGGQRSRRRRRHGPGRPEDDGEAEQRSDGGRIGRDVPEDPDGGDGLAGVAHGGDEPALHSVGE